MPNAPDVAGAKRMTRAQVAKRIGVTTDTVSAMISRARRAQGRGEASGGRPWRHLPLPGPDRLWDAEQVEQYVQDEPHRRAARGDAVRRDGGAAFPLELGPGGVLVARMRVDFRIERSGVRNALLLYRISRAGLPLGSRERLAQAVRWTLQQYGREAAEQRPVLIDVLPEPTRERALRDVEEALAHLWPEDAQHER